MGNWADDVEDDVPVGAGAASPGEDDAGKDEKAPKAAEGSTAPAPTAAADVPKKDADAGEPQVSAEIKEKSDAVAKLAAKLDKLEAKGTADGGGDGGKGDGDDEDIDEDLALLDGLKEPGHEVVIEQSDPSSPLFSAGKFEDLDLQEPLLKGIYAMKFNKPSKIQEKALPAVLGHKGAKPQNLIAQAQSGTGKTAAFTLSMLSRIDWNVKEPQALCVAPARELAIQTSAVVRLMGRFTPVRPCLAVKGASQSSTIKNQIVVGTPGTMLQLIKKKQLSLAHVRVFVLDEADFMLSAQGMRDQTVKLKQAVTRMSKVKPLQILLFSATYAPKVESFAKSFVPEPRVIIKLKKEELTLDKIHQFVLVANDPAHKKQLLEMLLPQITVGQCMIFVDRRDMASSLCKDMVDDGHTVTYLHGQLQPDERDRAMKDFRDGRTRVLISTDVLGRGIDILAVNLVVNFDVPMQRDGKRADVEQYIHRIGRTGRFGRKGIAINMVHDGATKAALDSIMTTLSTPSKKVACEVLTEADIDTLEERLKAL